MRSLRRSHHSDTETMAHAVKAPMKAPMTLVGMTKQKTAAKASRATEAGPFLCAAFVSFNEGCAGAEDCRKRKEQAADRRAECVADHPRQHGRAAT
jgi:hypothetical protein